MAFSERHITSSFFPWRNGTESLTQQNSCELVIRAKPNTSFPNQLVDGFVSSVWFSNLCFQDRRDTQAIQERREENPEVPPSAG